MKGEAFTRKTLVFREVRPKSEEVKAKKRKLPDARTREEMGWNSPKTHPGEPKRSQADAPLRMPNVLGNDGEGDM